MSLLTIIGILPLISAGLIALIPTKNSELIKRITDGGVLKYFIFCY